MNHNKKYAHFELTQYPQEHLELPECLETTDSLKAQIEHLNARNFELELTTQTLLSQTAKDKAALMRSESRNSELEQLIDERRSKHRAYRRLFDLAPIAYLSTDQFGVIDKINLAATCILQKPSTYLTKTSICDYFCEEDESRFLNFLESADNTRLSQNWHVTLQLPNGASQSVMLSISSVYNTLTTQPHFQVMVVDMTQRLHTEKLLRNANDYLEQLAHHDPLTKLPNRIMFNDLLQTQIANKSVNNTSLGLIYFDLDGFKPVNDTLGHHAGDHVLREVSDRVRRYLGPADSVARIGGDEFTIILDNPGSSDEAVEKATEVADAIRQPIVIDGVEISVTSSMGISIYPDHASDMETLIKGADAAMYQAKNAGKDKVRLFSRQSLESTDRLATIQTCMSSPTFEQQLSLQYQPIYNTASRMVESVEALIRWEHPSAGIIMPCEFIPLAEESNHILQIGQWVLSQACKQSKLWRSQGLNIPIAVNVSARQLLETDFAMLVSSTIEQNQLQASAIEIEITESAIMQDHERCSETLARLVRMGHTITIDDFGTGYSALARLANLPVSRIKIDRMFIKDMDTSQQMRSVVQSIIGMAHKLGLEVVTEGIEVPAQLKIVQSMKSDFIQGFLISRAIPANDLSTLVRLCNASITSSYQEPDQLMLKQMAS